MIIQLQFGEGCRAVIRRPGSDRRVGNNATTTKGIVRDGDGHNIHIFCLYLQYCGDLNNEKEENVFANDNYDRLIEKCCVCFVCEQIEYQLVSSKVLLKRFMYYGVSVCSVP